MKIITIDNVKTQEISYGRTVKRLLNDQAGAENLTISWIEFPPGVETEKHTRENEEIRIPLTGKGFIRTSEGEFEISPGMIVFLAPGDDHYHITKDSSLSQYVIFAPPMRRK